MTWDIDDDECAIARAKVAICDVNCYALLSFAFEPIEQKGVVILGAGGAMFQPVPAKQQPKKSE
jgi:hypothetical protein